MQLTEEQVVNALVQRGVPVHAAQGVAMNFRDESGLRTDINEGQPISGRGGFGLAQWTGPRRNALESFAASRGTAASDPNTQFDFFMMENQGPERGAWERVVNSATPQEAAVNFVNHWERPAAQHAASRTAKYSGVGGAGVYPTGDGGALPTELAAATVPNFAMDPVALRQRTDPYSMLADDLSRGVSSRGSGGGSPGVSAMTPTQQAMAPTPPLEFASATPETPEFTGTPGGELAPLASLFKVGDIGQAEQLNIDPRTGLPLRRRAYG
jgi:hypothetical protein